MKPAEMPEEAFAITYKKELSGARIAAQTKSVAMRRSNTDVKLSELLERIALSLEKDQLDSLPFKERVVAVGILYDKLYRNERNVAPVQAVQINIKAPEGQPPLDLRIGVPSSDENAS